jgi:FimV-like protein
MKKIIFACCLMLSGLVFANSHSAPLIMIFGPTMTCDSLWRISADVAKTNKVIPQQVMMALLKANPNAFYAKNVNGLMVGFLLNIPKQKELKAVTEEKAILWAKQQNEAWKEISIELSKNPALANSIVQGKGCPAQPNKNRFRIVGITPLSKKISAQEMEQKSLLPKALSKIKQQQDTIDQLNQTVETLNTQKAQLDAQQQVLAEKMTAMDQDNAGLASLLQKQQVLFQEMQSLQTLANKLRFQCYLRLYTTVVAAGLLLAGLLLLLLLITKIKYRRCLENKSQQKNEAIPAVETNKPDILSKKINYGSMAGEDVMTTQLDLARTYIEMGDVDHAKNILKTVIQDGNSEHKKIAKELLVTMGEG